MVFALLTTAKSFRWVIDESSYAAAIAMFYGTNDESVADDFATNTAVSSWDSLMSWLNSSNENTGFLGWPLRAFTLWFLTSQPSCLAFVCRGPLSRELRILVCRYLYEPCRGRKPRIIGHWGSSANLEQPLNIWALARGSQTFLDQSLYPPKSLPNSEP